MTLNANAKAFVPGGGSAVSHQPTPVAPPEPPLFRYNLVLNASRSVDTETTPSSISTLSFLLSRRSLVGVAKGGPGMQAARLFYEEYFAALQLPLPETPSTPLSANGLYVPSNGSTGGTSNVGFFFSRDQLQHASEILVEANDRDGFLIPLVDVPSHGTHHVIAPIVADSWERLFQLLYHDTRVAGMGYVLVEGPKVGPEQATTYYHYFFVTAAAAPKQSSTTPPAPGVQQQPLSVQMFQPLTKHGAIRFKHVLPYVLCGNTPLGAVLRVTSNQAASSDSTADREKDVAAGVFRCQYDALSASRTLSSIATLQHDVLSYLNLFPRRSSGKMLTDIVDIFVHVVPGSSSSASSDELRMSFAALVQTLELFFRSVMGVVVGCVAGGGSALNEVVENVVNPTYLVKSETEVAELLRRVHQKQVHTILSTEVLNRSMLAPLHGVAGHVGSVSDYKAVLVELNEVFSAAPVANDAAEAAANSGGKPTAVGEDSTATSSSSAQRSPTISRYAASREVTADNLLTRAVFGQNINQLVKEQLRARRRLLGAPVLVVVDSNYHISLVNLITNEVASMVHTDIWSCLNWSMYGVTPASCVLDATLVSTYRGDRQSRLIVHDVLRWNGVNVLNRPFAQRFAHLDPLEEENNWCHTSLRQIVILRAQYVNLAQVETALLAPQAMNGISNVTTGQSLLAAPSAASGLVDHPYLGFNIVSTGPGAQQTVFVWLPQDSLSARFQSGMVETTDATRRAHLLARKDPAIASATSPSSSAPKALTVGETHTATKDLKKKVSDEDAASADCDGQEEEDVDFYHNQFVDFYASEVDGGSVEPGYILHCLLRRVPLTQEHYWELLTATPPPPPASLSSDAAIAAAAIDFATLSQTLSKVSFVDAIIASPMITSEEWRWLLTASNNLCSKCGNVEDRGKTTGGARSAYVCRACWEADGYGDCLYCHKTYVHGGKDTFTDRFYCENCWGLFQTSRTFSAGAPPPPPDATFNCQVSTRVFSLLIDAVCGGKGVSNDVLELCAGGSVVRKWAAAQVQRYLAIDKNRAAVDDLEATVAAHKPAGSKFDVVLADAFSPNTWQTILPQRHPEQFHVVTCFHGLHNCFDSEAHARDVIFRIANSLVPNGVFLAGVVGANALFQRGRDVTTAVFQSSWGADVGPRLGASYHMKLADEETNKKKFVVPLDVLVAIASDYHLQLVEEHCTTFADVLARDAKWLRPTTQEEKDYLATLLTVVFRKAANRETASA